MRIIVFAAMVLIVLGGLVFLRTIYTHRLRSAKWEPNERSSAGGKYIVELVKPGESPFIIASLNKEAEDFNWDLELARSEQIEQRVSLNNRVKLLK